MQPDAEPVSICFLRAHGFVWLNGREVASTRSDVRWGSGRFARVDVRSTLVEHPAFRGPSPRFPRVLGSQFGGGGSAWFGRRAGVRCDRVVVSRGPNRSNYRWPMTGSHAVLPSGCTSPNRARLLRASGCSMCGCRASRSAKASTLRRWLAGLAGDGSSSFRGSPCAINCVSTWRPIPARSTRRYSAESKSSGRTESAARFGFSPDSFGAWPAPGDHPISPVGTLTTFSRWTTVPLRQPTLGAWRPDPVQNSAKWPRR